MPRCDPDPGAVHVWRASLDAGAAEPDREVLAAGERERAERYVKERDRLRWEAGRAFVRRVLGAYLDADPAGLRFETGEHGKPRLRSPDADLPLHFNFTRSGACGLLSVTAAGPVGVDVERVREIPDARRLARRFFAPDEVEAVERREASGRRRAFLRCWTRKEAVVKALGGGLSVSLDRFSVAGGPGWGKGRVRWRGDEAGRGDWYVQSLAPRPGWIGAVATAGAEIPVERRVWRP